jgi:TPR repeat protein
MEDRLNFAGAMGKSLLEVEAAFPTSPPGKWTGALWAVAARLARAGDVNEALHFVAQAEASTKAGDLAVAFDVRETAEALAWCDGTKADLRWIETLGGVQRRELQRAAYAGAARGMVAVGENPKFRRLRLLACAGDVQAMVLVARLYERGTLVAADAEKTRYWYGKARDADSAAAAAWMKAHGE